MASPSWMVGVGSAAKAAATQLAAGSDKASRSTVLSALTFLEGQILWVMSSIPNVDLQVVGRRATSPGFDPLPQALCTWDRYQVGAARDSNLAIKYSCGVDVKLRAASQITESSQ
jgi:hypothetical protein